MKFFILDEMNEKIIESMILTLFGSVQLKISQIIEAKKKFIEIMKFIVIQQL